MAFFGQKHGLTPFKKCFVFDLEKLYFLRTKKVSFFSARSESIISRLILIKFKLRKKLAFFGLKHGLTPLKKNRSFWTLKNAAFYSQNRFLFSLHVAKHFF